MPVEKSSGLVKVTKAELVWPGKYNEDGMPHEAPRISLPFQGTRVLRGMRIGPGRPVVSRSRATRSRSSGPAAPAATDPFACRASSAAPAMVVLCLSRRDRCGAARPKWDASSVTLILTAVRIGVTLKVKGNI